MIKKRVFEEDNYMAVWFNGKTIRVAIDPMKPIGELEYPEFYDIKLTSKCQGKCNFCYMDSKEYDENFDNAVDKINQYFGNMTENQRPFQVALGGGEPTIHPDFNQILRSFYNLGIEPNYTTNGMWVKEEDKIDDLINSTKEYCGGVAISCHPHLIKYWEEASELYIKNDIKLNFHIIISDRQSIDYFRSIYDRYKDVVAYFVLLPFGSNIGRAGYKEIDWDYLIEKLPLDQSKLAFGANFHPYLKDCKHNIKVSLYEPEIMSKFITLEGKGKMYNSSFDIKTPIKENLFK